MLSTWEVEVGGTDGSKSMLLFFLYKGRKEIMTRLLEANISSNLFIKNLKALSPFLSFGGS